MKTEDQVVLVKTLHVTSPAFQHLDPLPAKYTCEGANINPPLDIAGIPAEAKSLALIIDDPDAALTTFVHWIVWNIPVMAHLKENSIPGEEGRNDFRKQHYGGPCPPSGTHHYFFKVYALDTMLDLPPDTKKKQLLKAMEGHILAKGEMIGMYKRKN